MFRGVENDNKITWGKTDETRNMIQKIIRGNWNWEPGFTGCVLQEHICSQVSVWPTDMVWRNKSVI